MGDHNSIVNILSDDDDDDVQTGDISNVYNPSRDGWLVKLVGGNSGSAAARQWHAAVAWVKTRRPMRSG